MFEILRYQTRSGDQPFTLWLASIEDKAVQAKVRIRLRRLELVVLLTGGSKQSQSRDIRLARRYWTDWKTRQNMTRKKPALPHHDLEVDELRADRALAVEYLKAAMESLDNPDDRAAGLIALRTVAEAFGGLSAIAREAGISREALYRSLSPSGNPTLKTLLAILNSVGMRLSVEEGGRRAA